MVSASGSSDASSGAAGPVTTSRLPAHTTCASTRRTTRSSTLNSSGPWHVTKPAFSGPPGHSLMRRPESWIVNL